MLQSPKRRPAVDACITLAAYLPLGQLAKLASHLLSAAADENVPQASRAPLVQAGLALADRLFASKDADALPQTASTSSADGSNAAVVKAVAALVGSNVSAAAERCLVQALQGRFSRPSIAAWYMSQSAAVVLKLCIAQPSEACSSIGTALIDALPPCRAEFCLLLPARLQEQGAQYPYPHPLSLKDGDDVAGGFHLSGNFSWNPSGHCHIFWEASLYQSVRLLSDVDLCRWEGGVGTFAANDVGILAACLRDTRSCRRGPCCQVLQRPPAYVHVIKEETSWCVSPSCQTTAVRCVLCLGREMGQNLHGICVCVCFQEGGLSKCRVKVLPQPERSYIT